jgi:uncharacterized protein
VGNGRTVAARASMITMCLMGALAAPAAAETPSPPAPAHAKTPWPGGRWEPGPLAYGVAVVGGVQVRMDDGVALSATIAYPADPTTGQRAPGKFPVIVQLTPYTDEPNTYLPGAPAGFVQHGYIAVTVRPRGTGTSGGQYDSQGQRDRRDGVEVVNWAAHMDDSNGKVGLEGCSGPGVLAINTAAAVGPHSPLKAIVAACSGVGEAFPHGVFLNGGVATKNAAALPLIGGSIGPTVSAYYQQLYSDVLSGGDPAYARSYWNERGTIDDAQAIVKNNIPALLWSGWNDVEDEGSLMTYAGLQNAAAGRPVGAPMTSHQHVSGRYQVVINDGSHTMGLDPTIWLEWFDTFLKGENTGIDQTTTPMHLYEVGSDRWINAGAYPMVNEYRALYLGTDGTLSAHPSAAGASQSLAWEQPSQPDGTLTYDSALAHDGATLSGPIAVTVYAKSNNTNLELIASLYDLAPDGTATLISNGALVGSQRALAPEKSWYDSRGLAVRPYQTAVADDYLRPNQPYRLDVALRPRLWSIAPGHALRLVLTTQSPSAECSTLFPLSTDPCFDTQPQLQSLPGGAYTILSDRQHPSTVNLPLLPYGYYVTARSAVTATSNGFSVPMYWGPAS